MTTATQVMTPPETKPERHVRHIRNWVAFLGIVQILAIVVGIIAGIIIAVSVHDANLNRQLNSNIANCQSVGGFDPSC